MSNLIVNFNNDVITKLNHFSKQKLEAGGLLLGHRYCNGQSIEYEVVQITMPSPKDIRMKTQFRRKDYSHIDLAKQFHLDTNGYGDYLGEWHTHPNGAPIRPSHKDIIAFKKAQTLTNKPLIHVIANSHKIQTYTSGGAHVVSYY